MRERKKEVPVQGISLKFSSPDDTEASHHLRHIQRTHAPSHVSASPAILEVVNPNFRSHRSPDSPVFRTNPLNKHHPHNRDTTVTHTSSSPSASTSSSSSNGSPPHPHPRRSLTSTASSHTNTSPSTSVTPISNSRTPSAPKHHHHNHTTSNNNYYPYPVLSNKLKTSPSLSRSLSSLGVPPDHPTMNGMHLHMVPSPSSHSSSSPTHSAPQTPTENDISLLGSINSNREIAVSVRKVNLSYKENILATLKGGTPGNVVHVLNEISLTVPSGAIYGLLGPSGCGKTSLLRCIMGCQPTQGGSIKVFGYTPGSSESGVPGPGVGFMPQEVALHSDLTIREMLNYFGLLYFIPDLELEKRINMLLEVLDLPPQNRMIGTLSGGQQRRVSFAAALIHKPRLLILDEPTVGVDPLLREKIWDYLVRITKEDRCSVIITTHYIEETRRADVVGFMRKGVLLSEGNPTSLIQRHNTNGLEGVFYKLCTDMKKETLTRKESTKSTRSLKSQTSIKERKVQKENIANTDITPLKIPYTFPAGISSLQRKRYQFKALMSKYLIQTSRQPESVIGQFVLPIICLVMFCICIGGTPSHLKVAVINEEDPPFLSTTLLKAMNPYIMHQINYTNFDEAIQDVKRGKLWGVLHIKENFSEAITDRIFFDENADDNLIDQSNVKLYADLTNKVLGITLDTVLVHTFEDFVKEALTELGYNPRVGLFPVSIGETVYGTFSTSDFFGVRDFAAPGFLIVITYSVAYALTCLSLLLERMDDMFERNYSTGVSTTQILISILSVRFIFVAMGTTILLTMAVFMFEVPCRGPFFGVLLMLFLQSIAGMGMGLCVSAVVPDFFICAAVSNGLLIFIFIISGVLWSLETLPYYVRWFSFIQPTTLPAESMRSMLTRGLGIFHPSVWPGFAMTITWIIIFLFTAVRIFQYQK